MAAAKLSEEQVALLLAERPAWKLTDGKWIVRKYRFQTYLKGISFVNRVAEAAEKLNHHPFIVIEYKLVTLKLTSWHAGGLTELDFTAAAAFDAALER
ncbi:4a-hydroxytetrahydrobiopterin dehydratase [Paenibacillus harenae]|uniref:4a-hydroxytetrahydrobiopterin dehydratase n=1 Tax=Paenibacillus harenae TaxID=306543 RepID=UPI002793861B|nr:4a-hydroxytetrahydrobiopterin dehydratase [Paenibacillus harenae]MDQ0060348.1 4a-hydroxytetrahydrobiopterin dehydratase [Paenibacillus harenae]